MTDSGRSVLALGVSILAVLLLVIVAGISDSAGNAALTFVLGLWLLWLINHPGLGSAVFGALGMEQQTHTFGAPGGGAFSGKGKW